MNVLDLIVNAGNGAAVRQLGSRVGLDEGQTTAALSALVPALASGVRRNVQSPGGLTGLVAALTSGNHQRYIDNPGTLEDEATIADGNGILGHVLGSKEVSRDVASQAAAQTGIGADVLKKLLPLAATVMMGAFAKQNLQGGLTTPGAAAGGDRRACSAVCSIRTGTARSWTT
jgi:hypothetical protein